MRKLRSDNPSKQNYNPAVICQRFGESKIQVVMLPLKPHGKVHKVISSCFSSECEKMASSWLTSSETDSETFLKAQIAVSEVLGRPRFNTARSIPCKCDLYQTRATGSHLQNRRRSI